MNNEERILNTMDEEAYRELQAENKALKKRSQEAEGELTIIKGIGNTSPEMKALKERVVELEKSLAVALEINEKHQKYNGRLQTRLTEVEEDNKKLANQIEDRINQLRKIGGL
jgi:adenylate kinase family enzyme